MSQCLSHVNECMFSLIELTEDLKNEPYSIEDKKNCKSIPYHTFIHKPIQSLKSVFGSFDCLYIGSHFS